MYTVDYFIKKFEAIPEDKWCEGQYEHRGKHCAYGHCGAHHDAKCLLTDEVKSLDKLSIRNKFNIIMINDGEDPNYTQPTPKQRILAALYDIKKMQQPAVKEVIRYVSVDPVIKEMEVVLS